MAKIHAKIVHIEVRFGSPREVSVYADTNPKKNPCRGEAAYSFEATGSKNGITLLRELLTKILEGYPGATGISVSVNDKNRIVLDKNADS